MARPRFVVKHFIACLNAKWDGPPSAFTTRTLENVSHVYPVPPLTEAPDFPNCGFILGCILPMVSAELGKFGSRWHGQIRHGIETHSWRSQNMRSDSGPSDL